MQVEKHDQHDSKHDQQQVTNMTASITKTSILSKQTRTLQIPEYNSIEFEKRLIAYSSGMMSLQEAFPDLSPSVKEFIKTGVTDEEWDEYMCGNVNDIQRSHHVTTVGDRVTTVGDDVTTDR